MRVGLGDPFQGVGPVDTGRVAALPAQFRRRGQVSGLVHRVAHMRAQALPGRVVGDRRDALRVARDRDEVSHSASIPVLDGTR